MFAPRRIVRRRVRRQILGIEGPPVGLIVGGMVAGGMVARRRRNQRAETAAASAEPDPVPPPQQEVIAPPPPDIPGLPPGWRALTDPNTSKIFYHNDVTKESRWDLPEHPQQPVHPPQVVNVPPPQVIPVPAVGAAAVVQSSVSTDITEEEKHGELKSREPDTSSDDISGPGHAYAPGDVDEAPVPAMGKEISGTEPWEELTGWRGTLMRLDTFEILKTLVVVCGVLYVLLAGVSLSDRACWSQSTLVDHESSAMRVEVCVRSYTYCWNDPQGKEQCDHARWGMTVADSCTPKTELYQGCRACYDTAKVVFPLIAASMGTMGASVILWVKNSWYPARLMSLSSVVFSVVSGSLWSQSCHEELQADYLILFKYDSGFVLIWVAFSMSFFVFGMQAIRCWAASLIAEHEVIPEGQE